MERTYTVNGRYQITRVFNWLHQYDIVTGEGQWEFVGTHSAQRPDASVQVPFRGRFNLSETGAEVERVNTCPDQFV